MAQKDILASLGFLLDAFIAHSVLAVAFVGAVAEGTAGDVATLHKFKGFVAVHGSRHFGPEFDAHGVHFVVECAGTLVASCQDELPVVEHGQLDVLLVQHFAGHAAGLQHLVVVVPPVTQQAGTDAKLEGVTLDGTAFASIGSLAQLQVGHKCDGSLFHCSLFCVLDPDSLLLPSSARLVETYTVSPPSTSGIFSRRRQSLMV